MRFLVDEMLSRAVVSRLLALGHFAERASDIGLRGKKDHVVWSEAFRRDALVITANARDFLKLAAASELHVGLILLRAGDLFRCDQVAWVETALRWIDQHHRRELVNTVLEVFGESEADVRAYSLPRSPLPSARR